MPTDILAFQHRFHRSTRHQDSEPCRNCGTEYAGNFCPECGQEAHTGAPTALAFIYEFLTRNVLERGKLPKTIWHLLRYPGGLTVDFLEGRRQRFIRPVRLYFGLSVLYFLVLSIQTHELANKINDKMSDKVIAKLDQKVSVKSSDKKGGFTMDLDLTDQASRPKPAVARHARAELPVIPLPGKNGTAGLNMAVPPPVPVPPAAAAHEQDMAVSESIISGLGDHGVEGVVKKRLRHFNSLPRDERVPAVLDALLNHAPKAMFFLVPVFAFLLKILFIGRKVPYGAHLLFAFHYHSLVFLGLLLMFLPIPGVGKVWISIWMWLYLLFALRKTYLSGWFASLFRLMLISFMYPLAISMAMVGAVIAAVLV